MPQLQTAYRYQPEHLLQGLRPELQRRAGPAESVFRAAHWPPAARVRFDNVSKLAGVASSEPQPETVVIAGAFALLRIMPGAANGPEQIGIVAIGFGRHRRRRPGLLPPEHITGGNPGK
jgi:hypothetical protein